MFQSYGLWLLVVFQTSVASTAVVSMGTLGQRVLQRRNMLQLSASRCGPCDRKPILRALCVRKWYAFLVSENDLVFVCFCEQDQAGSCVGGRHASFYGFRLSSFLHVSMPINSGFHFSEASMASVLFQDLMFFLSSCWLLVFPGPSLLYEVLQGFFW